MSLRRPHAWGAVAGALVVAGAAWAASVAWVPPTRSAVVAAYVPSDAVLEARDGRPLQYVRIDPTRRRLAWTPLAEISPALVRAVVEAEDRRFYAHPGVDPWALGGAAWQRLSSGTRRGGSTITMQLAALLDESLRPAHGRRRSVREKLRQMQAAVALDAAWGKDQILEAYLNLAAFRGEVEGVRAAAEVLLEKSPHGIDAAEAALLAALLPAPSAPPEVVRRRARRLASPTRVADADLDRAAGRVFARPDGRGPTPRLAPHLARRLLGSRPGVRAVRSTVDADLQRYASRALQRELASIRHSNVRDGAVVVLDNASGDVLAYVASSGPHATARHVDGVRARRQAGSTLKPFLYALAIERRLLTAASLLDDSPLEVPLGGAVYRPRNYDDGFRGTVTLRTALASSLNVPAVRTQRLVGEPAFVDRLAALGFTDLVTTGDHYGPSLTLGTAEVSLIELANAYRSLARGGVRAPVRLADDAASGTERRVFSPETSFVVAHILSDREARSATFGLENALATRFWTAVKTGTSKEMRDNWCVGFSERYTVAVWVGNSSGEPMHHVSGITGAAPTWLAVMSHLHRDVPSTAPRPPTGLVQRTLSFPDGRRRPEWFLRGTEPATSRIERARAPTRIQSPVDQAIHVLDPNIPPTRERIALVAEPPDPALSWRMNGTPLGSAGAPLLWPPRAGRHELVLEGAAGNVVDRLEFRVRSGGDPYGT